MASDFTILQVNDYDITGGSEVISMNLFLNYLNRGYSSYLLVGMKKGSDPRVQEIPMGFSRNPWERIWLTKAGQVKHFKDNSKTAFALYYFYKFLAHPINTFRLILGGIDFDFPATWSLLNITPNKPDLLHLHNLHGHYFDLRALPYLSHEIPVILTLHDTLLTGECSKIDLPRGDPESQNQMNYSINKRTEFAGFFHSKDSIKISKLLKECKLYISSPSKWLMDQALNSIIAPSVINFKIIPHGVDLSIYHPYDQIKARKELSIPLDKKVLIFAANGIRTNPSKDYMTLRSAIECIATSDYQGTLFFIALGETGPNEKIGNTEIHFVPFISDPGKLSRYYQAADLYIHASHTEAWGLTITEALACGTPVVATAVGGIPDQIINEFNGYLTIPGNPIDMAEKILLLLRNELNRKQMGINAAKDVKVRFDLNLQVDRYLQWYQEILQSDKK